MIRTQFFRKTGLMKLFNFSSIVLSVLLPVAITLVGCSDPQKEATRTLNDKGYELEVRDLLVAAGAGDSESIALFKEAGFDIDTPDEKLNTALIRASGSGHTTTVEKLLGMGADPRHVNEQGRNALIVASAKGHEAVARVLMARGAETEASDIEGWSALSIAAYNGHENLVSLLSSHASSADLDDALLVASFTGDSEVIQTLLSQGANINARSPESRTPLMIASEGGHLSAVRTLLQNQANPYAVDNDQSTAVILAEEAGHPEVKEFILNPEGWGQSEQGSQVSEEMKMARTALIEKSAVEETLTASAPVTVAATSATAATSASPSPSTGATLEQPEVSAPLREKSQKVREEAKEKPIVALNGSRISSTDPKIAPVKSMVLAAYHEEPLPVVVENVDGKTANIRMMNATSGGGIEVSKGATIPGTNYEVKEVTRKFVSSKEGKGRMVDVSRVEIEDKITGNSHLLVKDVSGQTSDSYAILTSADSKYRYVVKAGDVFRTATVQSGETDYQVLDIRPSGVVIKNLKNEEVTTVARDGVINP